MLLRYRLLPVLLLTFATLQTSANTSFSFGNTRIELLDSAAAAAAAGRSDVYTKALTPFDLRIRLETPADPDEADYLYVASREVRNWPESEAAQLKKAFKEVAAYLKGAGISLRLPETIQLIRTTGVGEFGAEGYTRENRILLNTGAMTISTHLIAHELFHVYSRYNTGKRDALYQLFGFKKCNTLVYAPALKGQVITNPDCPDVAHYLRAQTPGGVQDLALILYSKKEFAPGKSLNELMDLGLMVLEGSDRQKTPQLVKGKPVIYRLDEVPAFFGQVGTNTEYLLHPEEISAEHFALMITGETVPQPAFINRMRAILLP